MNGTGISDPSRVIAGDLLRLVFFAARAHPEEDVRIAILKACDLSLDAMRAPPRSERDVRRALAFAKGPAIAPMLATNQDISLIARVWRACAAMGKSSIFVGSADAVGEGYGAVLESEPAAIYQPRESRVTILRRGPRSGSPINGQISINLGMLPNASLIGTINGNVTAKLQVDPKEGISVILDGIKNFRGKLDASTHSWISSQSGHNGIVPKLQIIHEMGLTVNISTNNAISLNARTAEAMIRFASACSSRNLFCLNFSDDCYSHADAFLVGLTPPDKAPCLLPAEVHSRSGPLAEWLRIPPLRLVPDLTQEIRVAIENWINDSSKILLRTKA